MRKDVVNLQRNRRGQFAAKCGGQIARNIQFQVLMKLTIGDKVNYIGKKGDWIYVQTESGKKGYVHYKSMKFVE